jgi:vacuolar protein sorting-associated protein 11
MRDDSLPYDRSHALMLCYIHAFVPGQILIWEKMGMYEDIIRYWIDQDRDSSSSDKSCSQEVLRHLDMYGPTHPHLYKMVLRYLTSSVELLRRRRDDVVRVLEFIERENVMAPIEVVQLLSRNNVASVGLVQQWLMKRIKKGKEEVATVRQSITPMGTVRY